MDANEFNDCHGEITITVKNSLNEVLYKKTAVLRFLDENSLLIEHDTKKVLYPQSHKINVILANCFRRVVEKLKRKAMKQTDNRSDS